ncbi:thiol-disulfide oxidoreductase DCC family protein [uncultured Litoreibacter sp.]|uniref:thiol-disulfide oxidoreductase DCC family protein n=1 Tax=uncultured Litoreibacter sp. TaxID=1392394 RepID=UPI002617DDA2|nr:DCC1-like thiol-disulfide oxidoreductase family protein [uncultured Litoreibacter sp.]
MRVLNTPYSWRDDPAVPAFADSGPVTVMDAKCGLCARGARWIARNDHASEFRIIPLQSVLGSALMRHFGMAPDDPLSWLYLEDGLGYSSLDATMKVGARLGGVWRGLGILRIIPAPLRDWAYGIVARNRYKVMGRADLCAMPDPDVQARLMQ